MQDAWNQFVDWCKTIYTYVTSHVPMDVMIYIGIAILILILIGIISRMLKKRRVSKRLSELEIDVNEIRTNSLQSKYNKAIAFARANEDLSERVNEIKPKYEICMESIQACEDLYEKAFDFFSRHKYKKAIRAMDEVETVLEDTEERIRIVTQSLDNVLSREAEVRKKAEQLNDQIRRLRNTYLDHKADYRSGQEFMDGQLAAIEASQAVLDEKLEGAAFNKAKEEIDHINSKCAEFERYMQEYPALYQKACVELPKGIEEVKKAAGRMEAEKIDPSYLMIDDKLDAIQNALKDTLIRLDNGNLQNAAPAIDAITDQVVALQADIEQEHEAFLEIHKNLEGNFGVVDDVERELNDITRLYASIKDRFGLEDWTRRFAKAREQMEALKNQRDQIQKALEESDTYQVEVIDGYRTFSLKIESFGKEVSDMKQMLVGASSDDNRARKQLVKLQLILNEVRLNTSIKALPAISQSFNDDLEQGEQKIADVQKILNTSPLDVKELNSKLQDAIDFIYKLYSNASNLVGVAVMVENAIVFGNRFRSSYPALDSDLNKAEICFQNGEYTRALKIAIQAIETLHPGIYEKLVARKDPAVMNQV